MYNHRPGRAVSWLFSQRHKSDVLLTSGGLFCANCLKRNWKKRCWEKLIMKISVSLSDICWMRACLCACEERKEKKRKMMKNGWNSFPADTTNQGGGMGKHLVGGKVWFYFHDYRVGKEMLFFYRSAHFLSSSSSASFSSSHQYWHLIRWW